MGLSVHVRPLAPDDDLVRLTHVIHSAYGRHADRNLRYWATFQTVDETAERFQSGQGLVAECDLGLVGTITVRPPQPNSEVLLYRDPQVWTLCQYAVLPECQGQGIGRQLHAAAVDHARRNGGRMMAIDTAAPAQEIIDMYLRWGYAIVGECDWRPHTNYVSVVMSRSIAD